MYPNSALRYFTLTGISESLSRVSLVSTAGKMVRVYFASKDGVYDISGLSEGIFLVIIEGDEGWKHTGRLMIKRRRN
ncbi:MAG: T9SS type A sorting domain-containing protein [Ekhidna sp.]|nr:T9SS type A sorting domain-containing protein [Ekhidna sp.]